MLHRLSCSVARGIFLDQDQTHVPFIGRQIINQRTTVYFKNGFPSAILLFMKYVHSEIRIFLRDQCSPKCKIKKCIASSWRLPVHISILQCLKFCYQSVQSLSLCDPVDCSTPGLLIHRELPKSTQTHVH